MTQSETSSNQEMNGKTMQMQDDFKDIALIRVGKFWLISLNEKKSKLPKTINQDPTLRIEVDGVDLLLLSDSCCYKIRQSENKITLNEYKSYFERTSNETISVCAKTDFITEQSFDKYQEVEKCTESSYREFKEHTDARRKGSYEIETEENTSTGNDRVCLPYVDRKNAEANLATSDGYLNNGANQHDRSMTDTSESEIDSKQDTYYQDLQDSESKETESQGDLDSLTYCLESVNLKGVKHEQSFEYRMDENVVVKTVYIEFTIEEFIRWVFFLNSPTKRKKCSQFQINQTVIELEFRPELCKVLTPLKSSMQIMTVIHHLTSQVSCSTTDVAVHNITKTYGAMSTETLKRITEINEEGILVKTIEESIYCAYLSSFEDKVKAILESIVQEKHVKSIESDADAKKVTCNIALPGHLPWADIFERFDLTNELQQKFQHVFVQIEKQTSGIAVILNGFESDVEQAKHFIQHDFADCIKRHEMKLTIVNTDVFLETNLLSFIKEQLQRTVHLELENKKVVLYYLKDESLSQAVALISSQIVEEEILLTGNRSSEDATSYLSNKYENSKNGCLVLVNRQRTKVTVTGWRLNVFEIVQHIQQQRKEDPECLQSTSTKSKTGFITMESTKTRRLRHLQPVQLWSALFARFNIANVLKKTAKSQDILIFREERKDEFGKQVLELVIEGQEADVDRLMTLFENDFVSKLNKTNLTENMTQVLLHFRMRESVQRQFPDVLFIVNKALVELYAFSNEICQDTANHLRKMFSEDKFILEEQVNKEAVLIDLERFQKEAEGVCLGLDEDDNAIIVSGLKDEVNRVLNELYQVSVSWYSTSKTHIVENREHFSVLQLDSPFLDQLKNAFDVDITYIDETDTQGLLIKGHASKIELCQRKIEDYQLSILTESIETDTTEEAVLTREFQLTLDGFPLCIDLQLEFTSNLFYKDEKREQKVWIFPNGQKLCLLNKDVIAPDTFVDVEVVEAIDQRGRYDSHSTRGKLSVTLHQPFIKKNTDNPFQRTKEIIQEILGEASKTNEEAISFQIPKLKTWNHGNLMKCWMAAFSEYFVAAAKRCSIKFILLCATKIDFSICLHPFKNEMVQLAHEQLHATPKNTRNEEFQIKVVKGKLNEIEADVLVNTTSLNLDLSKGSVSKCILKTAGTQLQTEVKQNYPNGIKPFEIAVTNGHGLSCKAVYHGALQFYDPKLGAELKREFQIFMQNCLMRASRENHLSIAFPAIGTGNLRYPLDFVVNEMFENVKQYKQIHRDTTLVKVLIVVFPGDFNACVKFAERQRLEDVGNAKQKKLTKPKIPCHLNIRVTGHKDNTGKALNMVKKQLKLEAQSNDLKPIAYDDALALPEYHNQPKKQTDITEDPLSEPRHVLDAFKCETVEGLIVKVYKEDILHLPVDCIVNPANGNLCHFAGLAAAIAKAAGKEFIVESNYYVQRIGYVAIGKAVQTTAGNLNYKCIIHAVGPNWNDYIPYTAEDVMACKEDLKQAIIASLDIAAQSGMKTIGIPAVSSALFGVPMELCAMQYVNAVQEFSARQRNSTTLKEVHFVDMDNNVVGIIIQAYTEMLINKVACPWNWKVYVKTEQVAVGERLGNSKQHTNIFASTPCFIENGNTLTCKFTKIHMVTISQEDIFSFKTMDAIVCSEDPSGSATGGVAKTLLRKGGKTYAQEKKQQYRMFKPKTGEVLITGGGETGYKHVMHAIMPHRTHFAADERGRAEWIKALSDMLTTIFDTAEKHSFKTMAMSLLGTGAGNSNPKQCASVLLDCFTSSCIRYRGSPFVLAIVNNDSSRNRIVADLFKQHIIDSQRYLATSTTDESKGYTTSDQGAAGNKLPPLQKEEKTEVMHCAICREHLNHPKTLTCGHTFCTRCFDKTLKIKPVCPSCGTVFGILKGNQPDGDMTIDLIDETLAGYNDCDTIRITYSFEGGKQQQNHPCPGKAYTASEARAYLPNNKEGREVLLLLKLAFERRLTFTFETSSKTGRVGVISWNDIHHKTDKYRNTQFGYPDPKYFNRIKQELAAKGVKAGDSHLDVSLLSKLDRHIKIVIPVKGYRMGGIFGTRV